MSNNVLSTFKECYVKLCRFQGLCFLLGMVLKAIGPHNKSYDSSNEFAPLLNNSSYGSKNDAWNIQINEKVSN